MRQRTIHEMLILSILGMLVSCAPRVVVIRGGPPPAWVDRMPSQPDKLCAVGYSGPTFYQQDGLKNAAENARGHLAESISVTIRTITLDISDGTRGSYDRDIFVEGSESASDAVLEGSEVVAQWMDMQGERGASKGCYAYVCIDPEKPIDKMVEKLKEKKIPPKTVEKVRANAEAAFDELEKLEAQKAQTVKPQPEPAPAIEPKEQPQQPPADDEDTNSTKNKDDKDETVPAVRKIDIPNN
ncbi:MAG TPA: hypothetical protein VM425_11215 [Myxococcota bacterium]|nr:hypothetical protein [Myxococcota bacterium]